MPLCVNTYLLYAIWPFFCSMWLNGRSANRKRWISPLMVIEKNVSSCSFLIGSTAISCFKIVAAIFARLNLMSNVQVDIQKIPKQFSLWQWQSMLCHSECHSHLNGTKLNGTARNCVNTMPITTICLPITIMCEPSITYYVNDLSYIWQLDRVTVPYDNTNAIYWVFACVLIDDLWHRWRLSW